MHPARTGMLAGVHILKTIHELEFLSGTALTVARYILRERGAVRVVIDRWNVPLAVEAPDVVWRHDVPELFEAVDEHDAALIRQSDAPAGAVAMRLHLTPKAVREFRAENPSAAKADGRGKRALTPEQREEIKALDGSLKEIAAMYGVSRQAVHQIKTYARKAKPTITREHLDIIRSDRPMREIMRLTGLSQYYIVKARGEPSKA